MLILIICTFSINKRTAFSLQMFALRLLDSEKKFKHKLIKTTVFSANRAFEMVQLLQNVIEKLKVFVKFHAVDTCLKCVEY